MRNPFLQLLVRWAILAIGVMMATKIVRGIYCEDVGTLVMVVLVLSFFNAILKPILVLFTLPFIILSLGLGVVVINALLFMEVGQLVQGFHVAGFWSALGGALVVSITNFVLSRLTRPAAAVERTPVVQPKKRPDDVIDI